MIKQVPIAIAAVDGPQPTEMERMRSAYGGAPMTRGVLHNLENDIHRLLQDDHAKNQLSLERQEALEYLIGIRSEFVELYNRGYRDALR